MAIARSMSIRPDSIINDVTVVVEANPAQTAGTVIDQTATSAQSVVNYGVQSVTIEASPLATNSDALLLAEYLIRSEPNFWFTGLGINMGSLTPTQRNVVSTLDIGDFVGVVKSFQHGTPSVVQKNLYVEGINHSISTRGHTVELYFSPVGFSQAWNSVTPTLPWQSVASGLTWDNLIWTIL